MWQVIARYSNDDYVIHDDRITDEECKVISPVLTVEDNKSGTLEFTIGALNNGYDKIYPMLTECRVLKNGKIIWFGRVLTADSDFYKRLKIHCEGGLSYLCDFYYPYESLHLPKLHHKYAFPQAVNEIMYWYNETLTDPKFISYGLFRSFTGKTVAFNDKEVVGRYDEEFIKKFESDNYRAWPYLERSSMTILDWLLASTTYYNGHLFATRETTSDGTWVQYLNFKSGYNTWTGQTIRFGENLLDYTKSIDGSNFHTAVRPYGTVDIMNGDKSESVNIDVRYILKNYFNDVNEEDFVVTNSATDPSQNYVMTLDKNRNIAYCHSRGTKMDNVDSSMFSWVDIYGIICKPFEINTAKSSEFIARLKSHFKRTKPESIVIEIRAVDMDLFGAASSDIEILDMIRVISKPHNIDGYFPVTKIEYHLDDPSQTTYTIDTGAVESQSSVTGGSAVSVDTKITSLGYKHPTYKENSLGLYKFANDAIGSVSDAQPVTKKDITDLGIPESDTNTKYELSKTGNTITLTGSDGSSNSVEDSDTTYELSLPTYANQKEPPVPMLSLNGSDGSRNEQAIPYAYTVLKNIEYEEFSGYEFGGNYRSIADLAYVIPYSKPIEIDPCIITADLYLETKMSDGYFSGSAYCFEHTESGSTIRRMLDNAEAYSGDFAETKDWAVLDDEMMLSNPKRLVHIIRIGVANEVFNRLTGGGCSRSRLMYHTSRDGAIARPISYYSDISIDASSQAKSHSVYSLTRTDVKNVAFTGDYNDLSNKPAIPDISGKQDKSTAVTHTANTAVGSATKPVYVAANGAATPISHSINADVPANAKFTDTTYSDATQSAHGLMTAADKKKLDGMDLTKYLPLSGGVMTGDIDLASNGVDLLVGSQRATQTTYATAVAGATISTKQTFSSGLPERKSLVGSFLDQNGIWNSIISVRHRNGYNDGVNYGMYLRSLLTSDGSLIWNKQTGAGKWQGERTLLDSTNYSNYAAKSDHTHAMIVNSALWVSGANNTAKWARLGTLVSSGNFSNAVIRVWSGDGANGRANQNSSFEIQIKDGWQSTESATKACGVTVYRINCSDVKVKVIPTAHDTYTVWAYFPWRYWNGNYAVYGKYKSWTAQHLIQSDEPEGTAADTAYYDQAFLTSTVAKATEATTLTETAWTALDYSTADKSISNKVKYKKYGKLVYIEGLVTPSGPTGSFCVGSIPSALMPTINAFGYCTTTDGNVVGSRIIVAAKGKVDIFSSSDTGINRDRGYNIKLSYLLD